jgi:hypothetical protein
MRADYILVSFLSVSPFFPFSPSFPFLPLPSGFRCTSAFDWRFLAFFFSFFKNAHWLVSSKEGQRLGHPSPMFQCSVAVVAKKGNREREEKACGDKPFFCQSACRYAVILANLRVQLQRRFQTLLFAEADGTSPHNVASSTVLKRPPPTVNRLCLPSVRSTPPPHFLCSVFFSSVIVLFFFTGG